MRTAFALALTLALPGFPTLASAAGIVLPPTIPAGQPFTVRLTGLPGHVKDWVTIVQAGAPDTRYGPYFYTDGQKNPTFTFGPLTAGTYEVRVYFDYPKGGYTVQARQAFGVGTAVAATPLPDRRPFTSVPARRYACNTFLNGALITLGHLDITAKGRYQGVRLGGGGPSYPLTYVPASGLIQFHGGIGKNFGNVVTGRLERTRAGEPLITITYRSLANNPLSMTCE